MPGEYPSEYVARVIRERITSGELRPGQKLEATHVLADQFGCSQASVSRAVRTLASEGLLITRRRYGVWVA